jgi:hypothetical protein
MRENEQKIAYLEAQCGHEPSINFLFKSAMVMSPLLIFFLRVLLGDEGKIQVKFGK